jgi:hypothetical protein
VLCEIFPVLQVSLLETGPCSTVTLFFPPPTSLIRQAAHVLPSSIVLHVLSVLAPKPGWLALCLLELVEGELLLSRRFVIIEWAHRPFLVFPLLRAP